MFIFPAYLIAHEPSAYLLFVNYEKIDNEYDIIDFRKGDIKEVIVFNDNIINY